MSIFTLPTEILSKIHDYCGPYPFAILCKHFHGISSNEINIANYLYREYGPLMTVYAGLYFKPDNMTMPVLYHLLNTKGVSIPLDMYTHKIEDYLSHTKSGPSFFRDCIDTIGLCHYGNEYTQNSDDIYSIVVKKINDIEASEEKDLLRKQLGEYLKKVKYVPVAWQRIDPTTHENGFYSDDYLIPMLYKHAPEILSGMAKNGFRVMTRDMAAWLKDFFIYNYSGNEGAEYATKCLEWLCANSIIKLTKSVIFDTLIKMDDNLIRPYVLDTLYLLDTYVDVEDMRQYLAWSFEHNNSHNNSRLPIFRRFSAIQRIVELWGISWFLDVIAPYYRQYSLSNIDILNAEEELKEINKRYDIHQIYLIYKWTRLIFGEDHEYTRIAFDVFIISFWFPRCFDPMFTVKLRGTWCRAYPLYVSLQQQADKRYRCMKKKTIHRRFFNDLFNQSSAGKRKRDDGDKECKRSLKRK